MKVIPVYLPQFHQTPENDQWWGEGFTEWTNVRAAKSIFEGHYQPRIPLNDNYYDLTDVETLKWQADLAKKYGIYGFCMYHYWFNDKVLLHKPMELLRQHPEINIKYCVSWANHDWTDSWKASNDKVRVLISHDFDNEDHWIAHFNYLLPFFKDSRYMVENNKPIMVIYAPNLIRKLNKIITLWNQMAIEEGFEGLTFIYQSAASYYDDSWDKSLFSYGVEFQPGFTALKNRKINFYSRFIKYSRRIKKLLNINVSIVGPTKTTTKYDYDATWKEILKHRPKCKNIIPSAFVDWDNTPRYKNGGKIYVGANPTKFKKYFKQLILNTRKFYNQDKIFVFAWNEWAEGGYLEPDKKYGEDYLKAIYNSLKETNEIER